MPASETALVRFHAGTGSDHAGRGRDDILAFTDTGLERVHDYIQWLFPLREASRFNPFAPVLTDADIAAFAARPELRDSLRRCLRRMLEFYGLVRRDDRIEPGPDFATRAPVWLTPVNHNHLRITRILTSLSLLGLGGDAQMLLDAMQAVAGATVSAGTRRYWAAAISAPA